jgi:hypothetical protein
MNSNDLIIKTTYLESVFISPIIDNNESILQVKNTGIDVLGDVISSNIISSNATIGNIVISNGSISNIENIYTNVIDLQNNNIITYDVIDNKIKTGQADNLLPIGVGMLSATFNLADLENYTTTLSNLGLSTTDNVTFSNLDATNVTSKGISSSNIYTKTITFSNNVIKYDDVLNKLMIGPSNNLQPIGDTSSMLYASSNLKDINNVQDVLSNIGLGSNNIVTFSNVNVNGTVSTDTLQLSTNSMKYDNRTNNIVYGSNNYMRPLGMIAFQDDTILNPNIWNNIIGYLSASTQATPVSLVSVSSITDTGATISWTGGVYSKVKVSWSGGSSGTSDFILTGTSSYNVTGLISSQSYTFTVTPYNSSDVAGTVTTSSAINTLATSVSIVSASSITDTGTTVSWTGGVYSKVKVSWSGGSSGTSDFILTGTSSYNVTGLISNQIYTFTVTPYNANDVAATATNSSLVSTLPTTITTVSTSSITSTGVTVSWVGGVYSKVKVSWSGGSSGTSAFILTGTSSYNVTGLIASQSYTFTVTPYNSSDVAATTTTSASINTLATTITTVSTSSITSTGVTVSWTGGVYSKVKVSWSGGSSGTSAFILTGTSTYNVTGLISNQIYTFTVTPYNSSDVAATATNSSLVSTLPTTITTVSTSSITSTGVTVSWTGGVYSKVKVSWSGGSSGTSAFILTGTSTYNVTGLISSQSYTFTVTPYNSSDIATTTTTSALINTLATAVSTVSISSITSTAATVSWTGGVYSKVKVSWSGGSSGTSAFILTGTSTYNVTGLISSQSYTFTVTPYNSSDVAATATNSSLVSTPNTAFTFTNCGATSRLGPTAANILSTYGSTVTLGNFQGYQKYTIPSTRSYTITCYGASGGSGVKGGGGGGVVSATFNLTMGQIIIVIVGQMGGISSAGVSQEGGGGGGTWVINLADSKLMICAGGGTGSTFTRNGSSCRALSLPPTVTSMYQTTYYQSGSGFTVSSSHASGAKNYGNGFMGAIGLGNASGYGLGGFGGGGGGGNSGGSKQSGAGGGWIGGQGDTEAALATPATSYVNTTFVGYVSYAFSATTINSNSHGRVVIE